MEQKHKEQPQMRCPHLGSCGGCAYSGMAYEEQLQKKHAALQTILGHFGTVEQPLPSPRPLHYRNKAVRSFAPDPTPAARGRLISGIYAAGTRRVVPMDDCEIEDVGAARILASVATLANRQHIPAYDPKTGKGLLRHALVRAGQASGEYLLTLITASPMFPGRGNFVDALRRAHPELTTIVQNVNGMRTGMILGDPGRTGQPDRVLFGPGFIRDTLCGLSFRISPHAFYQVNRDAAELLYETAIDLADLHAGDTLFDAYCGVGTIGMSAAARIPGLRVTGVELNPDAVKDAIANAKHNHIPNIRFYQGDAGKFLSGSSSFHPTAVILDPPRGGSDEAFLSALAHAAPEKILYISCGPEALARDLVTLTASYRVERIVPVDLFPGTEHVETVVLMSRVEK